jgi:DNA invertase Pin-like site-specific DNA recombinase
VVVHSMDRLARSLDDLRKLVLTLTKRGIQVQFVKESLTFSGEGSLMAMSWLSMWALSRIMWSTRLCKATAPRWHCGLHISDVGLRIIPGRTEKQSVHPVP